jgi:hypothetical protein
VTLFLLMGFIETQSQQPVLRASCIKPKKDVVNFCQIHQSSSVVDCTDSIIPLIQRRCSTWLDSNKIEIPVSFEADPAIACALPITVDDKEICVLTKEQAAKTNSLDINKLCQSQCSSYRLNENQCNVLLHAMQNISNVERKEKIKNDRINSSVDVDTFMYPNGDLSWYYLPSNDHNIQEKNNNLIRVKWDDGHEEQRKGRSSIDFHTMLTYGTLKIVISSRAIDLVCLLIQRFGDITSSSAFLNLGCISEFDQSNSSTRSMNVLIGNIPFGPHRIILDGFTFKNKVHVARSMSYVSVVANIKEGKVNHPSFLECQEYHKQQQEQQQQQQKSFIETPPTISSSLSLLTLVHRGKRSLKNALQSWHESGLLNAVAARVAYVQNYVIDNIQNDSRVQLLQLYNFTIVGMPTQQGIGPGISKGIESCTTTSHVLFLEEDFVVSAHSINNIVSIVQNAFNHVWKKEMNVIRLRSFNNPGYPNCANVWKGRETKEITSDINLLSSLDLAVVNSNNSQLSPNTNVWRCGEGGEDYLCAYSFAASWTNNPFLIERSWFLKHIAPIAAVDPKKTLEAAVSFSSGAWGLQCFIVGQSMITGGFTHRDLDKKQYEQTVCPDIF